MAWCLPLLVVGCFTAPVALAQEVRNTELGLTISVPAGFVADARIVATDPSFVLGFRRDDPAGGVGTFIIIERLNGVLGRERLDLSKLPPGTSGKILLLPWNGFEVEAIEVPESLNGIDTLTYNVQVPLKPRAIQLKVWGLRERSSELQALVNTLLGTLRGETNWKRSLAPRPLSEGGWYGPMLVGGAILIIGSGVVGVVSITRRRSRLAGLTAAGLLLMVGFGIRNQEYRELLALSGSLRLAGFCGLLAVPLSRIRRRPCKTGGGIPPGGPAAV